MEAVAAGVSTGVYSTQSGGGGSKPPSNIASINRAAIEALNAANGNDPHYEFGLKAVTQHCNALYRMGILPTEEIDLGPYINQLAKANNLTGARFQQFERGVLQGRRFICKQMKAQSLHNKGVVVTSTGVVIGKALADIKNTITGEKFYDMGFRAAWKFCSDTNAYLLPYFELLETDGLIKAFSEEYKFSPTDLEKFKKGLYFVIELVISKLKEIKALVSEDEKERCLKIGKDLARKYYDDPTNRGTIINLYEGKSKILEAFYNYIEKNRSHWKYAHDVPGVTDFSEIRKKSLALAVFVECFISSINTLLKENEQAIQAHRMDPEDLAEMIEEGSKKEEGKAPSRKSGKKKKKRSRKPKVEGAPNVEAAPNVETAPNVEGARKPEQGLEIGEELTPVDAGANSKKELSDVKTSSSPVACATFPKLLTVKNEEFSVPVLTLIKTRLMLTDELGNPINIDGEYTPTQRQIFKVCVLFMINSGFFNRLDLISQEDAASRLGIAIPANDYDPRALNCKLYNQEVSVFDVLRDTGFTFYE